MGLTGFNKRRREAALAAEKAKTAVYQTTTEPKQEEPKAPAEAKPDTFAETKQEEKAETKNNGRGRKSMRDE